MMEEERREEDELKKRETIKRRRSKRSSILKPPKTDDTTNFLTENRRKSKRVSFSTHREVRTFKKNGSPSPFKNNKDKENDLTSFNVTVYDGENMCETLLEGPSIEKGVGEVTCMIGNAYLKPTHSTEHELTCNGQQISSTDEADKYCDQMGEDNMEETQVGGAMDSIISDDTFCIPKTKKSSTREMLLSMEDTHTMDSVLSEDTFSDIPELTTKKKSTQQMLLDSSVQSDAGNQPIANNSGLDVLPKNCIGASKELKNVTTFATLSQQDNTDVDNHLLTNISPIPQQRNINLTLDSNSTGVDSTIEEPDSNATSLIADEQCDSFVAKMELLSTKPEKSVVGKPPNLSAVGKSPNKSAVGKFQVSREVSKEISVVRKSPDRSIVAKSPNQSILGKFQLLSTGGDSPAENLNTTQSRLSLACNSLEVENKDKRRELKELINKSLIELAELQQSSTNKNDDFTENQNLFLPYGKDMLKLVHKDDTLKGISQPIDKALKEEKSINLPNDVEIVDKVQSNKLLTNHPDRSNQDDKSEEINLPKVQKQDQSFIPPISVGTVNKVHTYDKKPEEVKTVNSKEDVENATRKKDRRGTYTLPKKDNRRLTYTIDPTEKFGETILNGHDGAMSLFQDEETGIIQKLQPKPLANSSIISSPPTARIEHSATFNKHTDLNRSPTLVLNKSENVAQNLGKTFIKEAVNTSLPGGALNATLNADDNIFPDTKPKEINANDSTELSIVVNKVLKSTEPHQKISNRFDSLTQQGNIDLKISLNSSAKRSVLLSPSRKRISPDSFQSPAKRKSEEESKSHRQPNPLIESQSHDVPAETLPATTNVETADIPEHDDVNFLDNLTKPNFIETSQDYQLVSDSPTKTGAIDFQISASQKIASLLNSDASSVLSKSLQLNQISNSDATLTNNICRLELANQSVTKVNHNTTVSVSNRLEEIRRMYQGLNKEPVEEIKEKQLGSSEQSVYLYNIANEESSIQEESENINSKSLISDNNKKKEEKLSDSGPKNELKIPSVNTPNKLNRKSRMTPKKKNSADSKESFMLKTPKQIPKKDAPNDETSVTTPTSLKKTPKKEIEKEEQSTGASPITNDVTATAKKTPKSTSRKKRKSMQFQSSTKKSATKSTAKKSATKSSAKKSMPAKSLTKETTTPAKPNNESQLNSTYSVEKKTTCKIDKTTSKMDIQLPPNVFKSNNKIARSPAADKKVQSPIATKEANITQTPASTVELNATRSTDLADVMRSPVEKLFVDEVDERDDGENKTNEEKITPKFDIVKNLVEVKSDKWLCTSTDGLITIELKHYNKHIIHVTFQRDLSITKYELDCKLNTIFPAINYIATIMEEVIENCLNEAKTVPQLPKVLDGLAHRVKAWKDFCNDINRNYQRDIGYVKLQPDRVSRIFVVTEGTCCAFIVHLDYDTSDAIPRLAVTLEHHTLYLVLDEVAAVLQRYETCAQPLSAITQLVNTFKQAVESDKHEFAKTLEKTQTPVEKQLDGVFLVPAPVF